MNWVTALPIIKQVIDGIKVAYNGCRTLVWRVQLYLLEQRKKKIQDANDPADWTDILNGRM